MLAQSGHAYARSNHLGLDLPEDTHNVVLAVKDEREILIMEAKLIAKGVRHVCIREPDEPWCGAAMAIGVYPAPKSLIGHHFRGVNTAK